MKNQKTSLAILLLILSHIHCSLSGQGDRLLLKDIHYIDVEAGQSTVGTILIEAGKIKAIGQDIEVPAGTTEIDGRDKWLIPGLVDAHIHLFQSGGLYTRPDAVDLTAHRSYETERNWLKAMAPDLLRRYLRCGITSVMDIGGPLYNYEIRDRYQDAEQFPNLWLTGPLVSTYQPAAFRIQDPPIVKVNSAKEAVALVQKQLPYRPDFIKIWYIALPNQTAESTYDMVAATIAESHSHDLKVAVHATQLNTAKLAVKAGADILVHSVSDPVDEEFARMLVNNRVVYIPTLMVSGQYLKAFGQKFEPTAADFAYSHPTPLGSLFDPRHFPEGHPLERYREYLPRLEAGQQKEDSIMMANLKFLSQYPITIATGTDAGNIGTLHASSYFTELDFMQRAGLTNAQILAASTINGARVLGKEAELGSIAEGKIADLVILNGNPLTDLEHLQDIAYVIKGGHLMAADTIIRETPEQLVQQQLNAYNARDIDAFLAPYSEDVELYNFPDQLRTKGKADMRASYTQMFAQVPELHCEIVNRSVLGNTVIDHERVTGFPGGRVLEAIAIYKIRDQKIAQVFFISE